MKDLKELTLVISLFFGSALGVVAQENAAPSDSLRVIIWKVKGITCSSDLKRISTNVTAVQGVASCKVLKQGPKSTFEVRYYPSQTNEAAVAAAIQATPDCENPDKRPYQVVK
jgi:copper chaperone CopZ